MRWHSLKVVVFVELRLIGWWTSSGGRLLDKALPLRRGFTTGD